MNRLWRVLFGRQSEEQRDEQELVRAVAAERLRLVERQERAERVLTDFRRAEAVIRGDVRGSR